MNICKTASRLDETEKDAQTTSHDEQTHTCHGGHYVPRHLLDKNTTHQACIITAGNFMIQKGEVLTSLLKKD